jgi:hypothetical protein
MAVSALTFVLASLSPNSPGQLFRKQDLDGLALGVRTILTPQRDMSM